MLNDLLITNLTLLLSTAKSGPRNVNKNQRKINETFLILTFVSHEEKCQCTEVKRRVSFLGYRLTLDQLNKMYAKVSL